MPNLAHFSDRNSIDNWFWEVEKFEIGRIRNLIWKLREKMKL